MKNGHELFKRFLKTHQAHFTGWEKATYTTQITCKIQFKFSSHADDEFAVFQERKTGLVS